MCANTFPWPLFYSRRFSLPQKEPLHVLLSCLPSGYTSFFLLFFEFSELSALPSINIYTGSHLILLYASSLKLLFKSLSASTAESSDTLPQCKVFEEIVGFFSLAAPVLPEYLLFGVFFLFILWSNTLNYLKQTNKKKLKHFPNQLGNFHLLYRVPEFTT